MVTTAGQARPSALDDQPAAEGRGRSDRPSARQGSRLTPYLFLAPGFLLFLVAVAYPLTRAFQMSLYDWEILAGATSRFTGVHNYARVVHDPLFWRGLVNSAVYMALTVPPQVVLGLGIALLLRSRAPAQPLFRVLFYLPVITSWVVVSLLFKYLFADSGLVNWTLTDVAHVTDSEISWLSSRWTAMVAICAVGVWKGIGWSMMIFLAALQGVPRELEEAADVDGANAWQRFRAVTLPAVRPAMVFVTVMLVIGGFNVFTSVLLMTNGGPSDSTQVLLTLMYRQAFTFLDFGYASALAVVLTVLVFAMSVVQLRIFRNDDTAEQVGT